MSLRVRVVSVHYVGKLAVFNAFLALAPLEGGAYAKLAIWSLVLAFTRSFATTTFPFAFPRWAVTSQAFNQVFSSAVSLKLVDHMLLLFFSEFTFRRM